MKLFCLIFLHVGSILSVTVWSDPPEGVDKNLWYWCQWLKSFTDDQFQMCVSEPTSIVAIDKGGQDGIESCREMFRFEKWNCTQGVKFLSYMHYGIHDGSPEDAILESVRSAGMTLEVARQCVQGNLTNCRCDTKIEEKNKFEKWHWKGCPQKISHSFETVTKFLKSEIDNETNPELRWMKLHNIRVGQEVVAGSQTTKCYCHGVSGSCTVRSCFKMVPSTLTPIAKELKSRYYIAPLTVASPHNGRLVFADSLRSVNIHQLIYITPSVDPCTVESPKDRQCLNPLNCEEICCNRGWNTNEHRKEENCNCTINEVFDVKCKKCKLFVTERKCK